MFYRILFLDCRWTLRCRHSCRCDCLGCRRRWGRRGPWCRDRRKSDFRFRSISSCGSQNRFGIQELKRKKKRVCNTWDSDLISRKLGEVCKFLHHPGKICLTFFKFNYIGSRLMWSRLMLSAEIQLLLTFSYCYQFLSVQKWSH